MPALGKANAIPFRPGSGAGAGIGPGGPGDGFYPIPPGGENGYADIIQWQLQGTPDGIESQDILTDRFEYMNLDACSGLHTDNNFTFEDTKPFWFEFDVHLTAFHFGVFLKPSTSAGLTGGFTVEMEALSGTNLRLRLVVYESGTFNNIALDFSQPIQRYVTQACRIEYDGARNWTATVDGVSETLVSSIELTNMTDFIVYGSANTIPQLTSYFRYYESGALQFDYDLSNTNQGAIIKDLTGNNNLATVQNYTKSVFSKTYLQSKGGSAGLFWPSVQGSNYCNLDGTQDALYTPDASISVTSKFRMLLYAKADVLLNVDHTLFHNPDLGMNIKVDATNVIYFTYNGEAQTIPGSVTISTSTWQRILIVCDSRGVELLVDGVSQGINATLITPGVMNTLWFGARTLLAPYFDGGLAYAVFYDGNDVLEGYPMAEYGGYMCYSVVSDAYLQKQPGGREMFGTGADSKVPCWNHYAGFTPLNSPVSVASNSTPVYSAPVSTLEMEIEVLISAYGLSIPSGTLVDSGLTAFNHAIYIQDEFTFFALVQGGGLSASYVHGSSLRDNRWHTCKFYLDATGISIQLDDNPPVFTAGDTTTARASMPALYLSAVGNPVNFGTRNLRIKVDGVETVHYPMNEGRGTTYYNTVEDGYPDMTMNSGNWMISLPARQPAIPPEGNTFPILSEFDVSNGEVQNPAGWVHNGSEAVLQQRGRTGFNNISLVGDEAYVNQALTTPFNLPDLFEFHLLINSQTQGRGQEGSRITFWSGGTTGTRVMEIYGIGGTTEFRTNNDAISNFLYSTNGVVMDISAIVDMVNGKVQLIVNGSAGTNFNWVIPDLTIDHVSIGYDVTTLKYANQITADIFIRDLNTGEYAARWKCDENVGTTLLDTGTSPGGNPLAITNVSGNYSPWSNLGLSGDPNFWTDLTGSTYEGRSWEDLNAHGNGGFNLWLNWRQYKGRCFLYEALQYSTLMSMTPEQVNRANKYFKWCDPEAGFVEFAYDADLSPQINEDGSYEFVQVI